MPASKNEVSNTPFKYDLAWEFSEGLAAVCLNDKLGYIDKSGKEVIPFIYDQTGDYYERFYELPDEHDRPWAFSDGLVKVESDGKPSYIDKEGKQVIPIKYDDARSFSEGLAAVGLDGRYGFIDMAGNEVIPLQYDIAYDFIEGLGNVELDSKQIYIDKSGREVLSLELGWAEPSSDGILLIHLDGETAIFKNPLLEEADSIDEIEAGGEDEIEIEAKQEQITEQDKTVIENKAAEGAVENKEKSINIIVITIILVLGMILILILKKKRTKS